MRTDEWVVGENSRLYSITLVRGVAGSGKMRTGEWVVQLEGVEYLGSWEMSTGDFVVQL